MKYGKRRIPRYGRHEHEQPGETGTENAETDGCHAGRTQRKNTGNDQRRRCCESGYLRQKEIKELKINPDVVDPDDVEMLEDLILSAVNEAIRQADEMYNNAMGKLTGGMGMGGMF